MQTRGMIWVTGVSLIITGCAHHERREHVRYPEPPVASRPAPVIISQRPPPAPVNELAPPQPSPNLVWSPGHWTWNGNWMWSPGQWMQPPHPRAAWVPGRWMDYRDGTWRYEPGYWR